VLPPRDELLGALAGGVGEETVDFFSIDWFGYAMGLDSRAKTVSVVIFAFCRFFVNRLQGRNRFQFGGSRLGEKFPVLHFEFFSLLRAAAPHPSHAWEAPWPSDTFKNI
jgi:hypothetical protein